MKQNPCESQLHFLFLFFASQTLASYESVFSSILKQEKKIIKRIVQWLTILSKWNNFFCFFIFFNNLSSIIYISSLFTSWSMAKQGCLIKNSSLAVIQ